MQKWKEIIRNADWHAAPLMAVLLVLVGGGAWILSAASLSPTMSWPACEDGVIQTQATQLLLRSDHVRGTEELRLIATREVHSPRSTEKPARRCILEALVDDRVLAFRFNIVPQEGADDLFLLVLRES